MGQDEDTITLLGPEQFYAFDGAGRVCHEFVRYIAQPNGTVLAQEVVKRVFDPADGGRELVIREAVGSAGSLWAAPQHETSATTQTQVRRHCQPPLGAELRTSTESLDTGTVEGQWTPWAFGLSFDRTTGAQTVSAGLGSYEVLWQVGDAESGRLVLQGEKDGETARLVLDEMGTTMTKELTDWQTGLRFHQGSILAASEMQWFPADATEGDTVVRIDEWFGFETDGSGSRPKNSREAGSAGLAGLPRAVVRACVVQTTRNTTRDMRGYYADFFDVALGLEDAAYALPITDSTTTIGNETTDDATSTTVALIDEESHVLSSLADDLLDGLLPAAGGSCGGSATLRVTRSGVGDVSASGTPQSGDWINNVKTFTYTPPPGEITATAIDIAGEDDGFDRWVDGAAVSENRDLTVDLTGGEKNVSVFFTAYELTMDVGGGNEENRETTVPSAKEDDNPHLYRPRATVQVSASPTYGFECWQSSVAAVQTALGSDNPGTFTITQNCTVTAVMKPLYTVTTQVYPSGEAGTVMASGWAFDNPERFYAGSTATLRALPKIGYRFSGWTEDLNGVTDDPASLLMDEDKDVGAVFEAALVSFTKAENQIYGFDDFTTPDSPWKSVALDHTDTAQAVITNGSPPAIYFQPVTPENAPFPDASVLPAQASGSPEELTVTGHAVGDGGEIEATLNQGGDVVREMGVAVYEPLATPRTVALIHVSLDGEAIPGDDIEGDALESYMNSVFAQCVYKFDIQVDQLCHLDYDNPANGGDGDGKLDYETPEEKAYIKAQLPFTQYDFVIYIVEEIDGDGRSVGGFAIPGDRHAFVGVKEIVSQPVEHRHEKCTHEMAHACASLDDIPRGDDDKNLMSYYNGYLDVPTNTAHWYTYLRKPQWDMFPRPRPEE